MSGGGGVSMSRHWSREELRSLTSLHTSGKAKQGNARQSVPVRPPDWRSCIIGIHQSSATRCSCVSGMTAVCSGCQWRPVDLEKLLISPPIIRQNEHQAICLWYWYLSLVFVECVIGGRKRTKLEGFSSIFPSTPLSSQCQHYPTCRCALIRLVYVEWFCWVSIGKPVQFVPLVHEKKEKSVFLISAFPRLREWIIRKTGFFLKYQ